MPYLHETLRIRGGNETGKNTIYIYRQKQIAIFKIREASDGTTKTKYPHLHKNLFTLHSRGLFSEALG